MIKELVAYINISMPYWTIPNVFCILYLQAGPSQRILVIFDAFHFNSYIPCEESYAEIRYGKDLSTTGARYVSYLSIVLHLKEKKII